MKPLISRLSLVARAAFLAVLQATASHAAEAPAPMAFSEIGAKATADYQGDAIGVTATPEGASLRTGFQKLSSQVTEDGFCVESTDGEPDGLRLAAADVGRVGTQLQLLPTKGVVALADQKVTWTRPGMVEEYSVSVDGVRQDFILAEAPAGTGELGVELALTGATAEAQADGARLVPAKSGRELAYSRLHVTDAAGRELPARLEELSPDRLAVRVDDTSAAYPVRVDPTFSDADWVSMDPGIPGTDGGVSAAVFDSAGNLYIGGTFTAVGGVSAKNIAKWNGSGWSALGSGMSGSVSALAVNRSNLYAGGSFITVGSIVSPYIANAIIGPRIQVEQTVGSAVPYGGTKSFGKVSQGSVSDLTFAIRNIGQSALTLTGSPQVAVSGTDAALFRVTVQPSSPIPSDGTTTFTVRFAPTRLGIKNAQVSISSDAETPNYSFLLTGEGIGAAPVLGNSGTATAKVGQSFSYLISATKSPFLYGSSGLPPRLVLNSSNGLIIGAPTTAGVYRITLSATNVYGTGTGVISLAVSPAAPVISSADMGVAVAGQSFSYQIMASNSPSSYGASGLPAGLSVDNASGLISGTPAAAGTSSITLSAANAGGTGTKVLTLTVDPAKPTSDGAITVHAMVGQSFRYPIPDSGNPSAFGAIKLPPGLRLIGGEITGSPITAGAFPVTLWWVKGEERTTRQLMIEVKAAPAVAWGKMLEGISIRVVRVDGEGHVYVAGDFRGTITVGDTSLTAEDGQDGFVAKLDGAGGLLWIRQLAGDGAEFVQSLVVDSLGNAHVAGVLSGCSTLAGTSLSNIYFGNEVYVAKITGSGDVAWVRSLGGPEAGVGSRGALAVDAAGFVYLGGWFRSFLNGGSDPLISEAGTDSNGFIARWNGNGALEWTRQITSAKYAKIGSLTVDETGDLLVTGSFRGTAGIAGTEVSPAAADGGAMVAKLTSTGSLTWARGIAGAMFWERTSIATGADGSVFIAGSYSGSPVFGDTVLRDSDSRSFAARLNADNGTFGWARDMRGTIPEIAPDGAGGVYVEDAGPDVLLDFIDFPGETGRRLVRLDASGTVLWIQDSANPTDAGGDDFPALAAGAAGRVYLAGSKGSTVTLDDQTLEGVGNASSYLWALEPRVPAIAAPVIRNPLTARGMAGHPFSYEIDASNSPTGYWVSDCDWGDFDPETGVINVQAPEEGTFTATIWAANEAGAGSATLTVTIGPDTSPQITSEDTAEASQGVPFSYHIMATGSPTGYTALFLPSGLSVDTDGGVIAGTPTSGGLYRVLLGATNASGTCIKWLTLTVNPAVGEALGAWRQQHFGTAENSGNTADLAAPDGDGNPNLVKYELLMTPGQSGSNRLPRAVLQGGRLSITFQRSLSRGDATIIVEAQSGPGGVWTEIARSSAGGAFANPANITEADAGSGNLDVTVRDIPNSSSSRFMRIRLER